MKPKFEDLGAEPAPLSAAELAKFIPAEVDKWAKVIKFASIKPEKSTAQPESRLGGMR